MGSATFKQQYSFVAIYRFHLDLNECIIMAIPIIHDI